MKFIDVPPAWLVLFILVAWAQSRFVPMGLSFGGGWADFLGGLLVGGGVLLMILAALELRRHKTTVIPHKTPSSMVQTGIYRRSRNPIYLGDVLLLTGLILNFDAVPSLALVPVFVWILEQRFILPEEDRLRRTFRADFARYERKTRRWI